MSILGFMLMPTLTLQKHMVRSNILTTLQQGIMFGVISYKYVIFGAIDVHQEQQVLPNTQHQVLIKLFHLTYAIHLLMLPD